MIFRWLHLSDLHQRPEHGREAQYQEILSLVGDEVAAGRPPHAVFLTGDLAWSGDKKQYKALDSGFLTPLRKLVGDGCPLLMVPGNHDVQRDIGQDPRPDARKSQPYTPLMQPSEQGKRARMAIALRFGEYVAFANRHNGFRGEWVRGSEGVAVARLPVDGRQVVVVGINTAWLCHDDEDAGKLTPGADLVATCLERVAPGADLVIVLGHHGWDEFQRTQRREVRQAFVRHKVLYLHGHYHVNETDLFPEEVAASYAVQAGSAFQAHQDSRWRNGLMLAEADLTARSLTLRPLLYRPGDGWKFDSWDFPNRFVQGDRVVLPLPRHALMQEASYPPPGWDVLDAGALGGWRNRVPSAMQMGLYFDGAPPDLEMVLNGRLGRRKVVGQLVERLRIAGRNAGQPLALLLTGAGGEGKSTAILQAAAALAGDDWTCLIRQRPNASLPPDFVKVLPSTGKPWLIVADEADLAVDWLADMLRGAQRQDIHLLLAAREIDWNAAKGEGRLRPHARVERFLLSGLDEDDAGAIADGLCAAGEAKPRDVVAAELLESAHDQDHRDGDGTLLGALLELRHRDHLVDHVRRFLAPLKNIHFLPGQTLLEGYAMIAAMHAEGQTYLSRPVLARALDCDEAELETRLIAKLRREAVPVSAGTVLLTRHRRIAMAVVELLRNEDEGLGIDVDGLYPRLAAAGRLSFLDRKIDKTFISSWTFGLARHFKDQGMTGHPRARAVAKAVYEAEPGNLPSLTAYTTILRETGQAEAALTLFLAQAERWRGRREFLGDWSVAAGEGGQPNLDVWLAARAVADDPGQGMDEKDIKVILAGLGRGCEKAALAGGDLFRRAQAACGRLGLRLAFVVDSATKRHFTHHQRVTRDIAAMTDAEMLKALTAAASAGADLVAQRDPALAERLRPLLGSPQSYRFTALARYLGPAG